MSDPGSEKRIYDHRLRDYVRETRDTKIADSLGVPRSTIRGWLNAPAQEVVSHEVFDLRGNRGNRGLDLSRSRP